MNTAPSEAPDQADMARLVEGRDDALNPLMERHGARLFHYLIRVLQDETEAADLAQETFVRVYQNRARFNPDRKFSTWLYAIATNLARDRLRWLARHPQVSIESRDDDDAGLKNVLPANQPTPPETLEAEERAAAVRRALAGQSRRNAPLPRATAIARQTRPVVVPRVGARAPACFGLPFSAPLLGCGQD